MPHQYTQRLPLSNAFPLLPKQSPSFALQVRQSILSISSISSILPAGRARPDGGNQAGMKRKQFEPPRRQERKEEGNVDKLAQSFPWRRALARLALIFFSSELCGLCALAVNFFRR